MLLKKQELHVDKEEQVEVPVEVPLSSITSSSDDTPASRDSIACDHAYEALCLEGRYDHWPTLGGMPPRGNSSILESPVIGWAPHPSVQEITLGSGHTYDLPITPESLRQWLRPMPTRARPP